MRGLGRFRDSRSREAVCTSREAPCYAGCSGSSTVPRRATERSSTDPPTRPSRNSAPTRERLVEWPSAIARIVCSSDLPFAAKRLLPARIAGGCARTTGAPRSSPRTTPRTSAGSTHRRRTGTRSAATSRRPLAPDARFSASGGSRTPNLLIHSQTGLTVCRTAFRRVALQRCAPSYDQSTVTTSIGSEMPFTETARGSVVGNGPSAAVSALARI
jgi:hypothetical protein